jgi:hypothetical protein
VFFWAQFVFLGKDFSSTTCFIESVTPL